MRGFIPFGAGAALALAAGWIGFPYAVYRVQPQPVDFSHQVHTEKAGAKCEDCHALRDDGSFAGVPTLKINAPDAIPLLWALPRRRRISSTGT